MRNVREYPPGGEEARARQCTCPVFDNHHGRGRYGDGERCGWFVRDDCPLHGGTAS